MWGAPRLLLLLFTTLFSSAFAFLPPSSNCFVLDSNYHLYDFTKLINHKFEHSTSDGDFVFRFCKDVQFRSQNGYVNYGRFAPELFHSSQSSFSQQFNNGDLQGCENNAFDLSGRTSQVSLHCGTCAGASSCTDAYGCICNVTSSSCRSNIALALKCGQAGPRVLKGFTAGFTPRGKEVVENGLTQWGYDKFREDYSFATEQRFVSLYFTAPATLSKYIKKPTYTVSPSKGLTVKLSGSAANGDPPTTESPTVLGVEWQCDQTVEGPYIVTVTVSPDGFNPIIFNLGKQCKKVQNYNRGGSSGWATFGVLCLTVIIVVSLCCCAGFCYNTRVQHRSGYEALPGVPTLVSYLDSASGRARRDGYRPAEEASSASDGVPRVSTRPPRTTESKYGTV